MTRLPSPCIVSFLLVAVAAGQPPHGQSRRAPAEQSYTSAATAILVDVVVRDRRGRSVTDLAAEDFEISEDGTAQKLDTFTRISRGGGIGVGIGWKTPAAPAASAAEAVERDAGANDDQPGDEATVALVFDHLSAETLRLAQRATLDYVPMRGESRARVGVFATDPGVRVVQRYTTERALVRRAVARLLPSGTSVEEQKADRTDELLVRRRALEDHARAIAASNASGAALAKAGAEVGEREMELRLLQTELNIIRSFESLDRDHRGYDTSLALLTVIDSLAVFPGRKTIVLFSQGLPASPALSAKLDAVVDAANRANVTAYAIDANGLRANSTSATMVKELQGFVDERTNQLASSSDRSNQPLTMGFERVEDTLRLDSRVGLARLAHDTGGFLVEQSNDLSAAFRRIDEDNHFHYLLTYSPTNTNFDGKFRAISVKVRRAGAEVFARKGYRATRLRPPAGAAAAGSAALALLDRGPVPNAFPVHAGAFTFPEPSRPGLTAVVLDVDTGVLTFDMDRSRAAYSAHASVTVRIREGNGRDLEILSQEYLLTGDARDVEAARKGEILFYREVALPPGVYSMESIVLDVRGDRASARLRTLTVPPPAPSGWDMSSLVLVNRVEEADDVSSNAPLYVGRSLLYPNVGETIRKSATRELPFYFTLYGRIGGIRASAQLLRNGQPLAEAPLQLPSASGGRLQHVGRLPIADLAAGTYELRILATDGRLETSRSCFFTIDQ
jgi:VWFA-related protein